MSSIHVGLSMVLSLCSSCLGTHKTGLGHGMFDQGYVWTLGDILPRQDWVLTRLGWCIGCVLRIWSGRLWGGCQRDRVEGIHQVGLEHRVGNLQVGCLNVLSTLNRYFLYKPDMMLFCE